jgi:hypothetical protein
MLVTVGLRGFGQLGGGAIGLSPFDAITLKWQAEMAIQHRQGNRFWLQRYYPL